MSAPENVDTRARLLTFLFWGGIALAPLAALLLVIAGSSTGGLRLAAIVAIVAVVAVGLSITMRRDASSTKLDLEETLLDEIDMLRDDVRADITTAARATHKALAEKVASLQETIEHMRRQAEAARAAADHQPPRPAAPGQPRRVPGGPAAPAGVVRHTETVQVTTRRTIVDPGDVDRAGYRPGVYGTRAAPPRSAPGGRDDSGGRDDYDRGDRVRVPRDDDRRGREDRGRDEADRRFDHGERSARDTSGDEVRAAWAITAARDEPWAEQRLRDYAAGRPTDPYSDSGEIRHSQRSRSADRDDDPADDERWSAMRAGDRWAEVRTDERGRELRMGERRAAVRTDETGTQLRIVDRWSSVRQEIPRTDDGGRSGRSDGYQDGEHTGETRQERRRREEAAEIAEDDRRLGRRRAAITADESGQRPGPARPALPASGSGSAAVARRDDRARDDRARDDRARPRDERGRDDHLRDDRVRDDRSRSDRPRGESRAPHAEPPRVARRDDIPSQRTSQPARRDDRDDDRWEREPSGPRSTTRPRRLDFEVTDDRWH